MMGKDNIAPATDRISGRDLELEIRKLNIRVRRLLKVCLETGEFHQNGKLQV